MNRWWKRTITSPLICSLGTRVERRFTQPPIFIGGCARSGTTLLLSILSSHPEVFAIPVETDAFTDWEGGRPVRHDRFYRQLILRRIPIGATRWCEKRPANIHYISDIIGFFGKQARFIHMIRDPRAVCTSVHPRSPNTYWVSPGRYLSDVSAGLSYKGHPQLMEIRYESLLLETTQTLRRVAQFLSIQESPLSQWPQGATIKHSRAWLQPAQYLDDHKVTGWHDPKHTGRVKEIVEYPGMKSLMEQLGYL